MTFVRKLRTFQNQLKIRTLFYYLLKSLEILTYISSLLKIICDLLRIKISFMDKQKFLISKNSIQISTFNCNKCILVRLWVTTLALQGWNYKLQYKHYNGKKQGRKRGGRGGGGGYGIFRGIEEIASGFFRG